MNETMYEIRLGIHGHKPISLLLPYHQNKYNPLRIFFFQLGFNIPRRYSKNARNKLTV